MEQRFSAEELYRIRNAIPVRSVISELLKIPSKEIEGVYRFLCPVCGEFQTAVNPQTNLSRCFRCRRNLNTIELVMEDRKISFVESVKTLQNWGMVGAGPGQEKRVAGEYGAEVDMRNSVVSHGAPRRLARGSTGEVNPGASKAHNA